MRATRIQNQKNGHTHVVERYRALRARASSLRKELDNVESELEGLISERAEQPVPERAAQAIERGLMSGRQLRGAQGPSAEARASRRAVRVWLDELFPGDPIWQDVLDEWAHEHLGYGVQRDLLKFLSRWRNGPKPRPAPAGAGWEVTCPDCGLKLAGDSQTVASLYVEHAFAPSGRRRRRCRRAG